MRLAEERATRRLEHWQNLAVAACEQCGRNRVPEVHPVSALPDWLGAHSAAPGEQRLILSTAADRRLRDLSAPQELLLLAGPEGGFAPAELAALRRIKDVTAVGLGPRLLRADTAALAALACWQALVGDWREPTPRLAADYRTSRAPV